jgi:hypothetical protein
MIKTGMLEKPKRGPGGVTFRYYAIEGDVVTEHVGYGATALTATKDLQSLLQREAERKATPVAVPNSDGNRYFVYVRGTKGPSPQLWFGDQVKGTDKFKHQAVGALDGNSDLLYFRKLGDEDMQLDLDALISKYPFVENFSQTKA